MDNLDLKLHEFQKMLMQKLAITHSARFNDLLIDGLESEHMNYHLKKLIEFNLVEKNNEQYILTDKGKDYSNLMDDNIEFIEKQPKSSVLLIIVRKSDKDEVEHLLCKRLRHPYFGKVGRLTGKIRFGETLEQAAKRELYEETGLTATFLVLEKIYHKMRYKNDGTYVQDVIFYQFFVKDVQGNFIQRTAHQENFWISANDLSSRNDIDPFESLELTERFEPDLLHLEESNSLADGY